ncbi:MAG: hypothetical protein HQL25_06005 [Candidatus Omnitrophica bacterium]|nr:hypothetical protein [Candidatus Omnitrophota bacterium]
MKVDVKKVDPTRRELNFEVSKERVAKKLEEIMNEISKGAKIKGFRPGKAPRNIIESQYGNLAKEEVLKKLIPEVYQEALEKEKLMPIDMPDIVDVAFKDGKITFKASMDIRPDVTVKDYKGIQVKRKSAQVNDEDIQKTLEYFKQGQGKEKEEIKIDDTFANGLGFPNLEELKKSLRRQLELDKERQTRVDLENQIVDAVLKKVKLVVPQSLVKKQVEHRILEVKERLKKQGMSDADITKKEEDIRNDLKVSVEKDIRVYLALEKIAEEEKIEVKPGENLPAKVVEFLLKEAKWEEEK